MTSFSILIMSDEGLKQGVARRRCERHGVLRSIAADLDNISIQAIESYWSHTKRCSATTARLELAVACVTQYELRCNLIRMQERSAFLLAAVVVPDGWCGHAIRQSPTRVPSGVCNQQKHNRAAESVVFPLAALRYEITTRSKVASAKN
jgi:hypothetical protein